MRPGRNQRTHALVVTHHQGFIKKIDNTMIFIEIIMLAIPIIGAISVIINSRKPEHTELFYEIKHNQGRYSKSSKRF